MDPTIYPRINPDIKSADVFQGMGLIGYAISIIALVIYGYKYRVKWSSPPITCLSIYASLSCICYFFNVIVDLGAKIDLSAVLIITYLENILLVFFYLALFISAGRMSTKAHIKFLSTSFYVVEVLISFIFSFAFTTVVLAVLLASSNELKLISDLNSVANYILIFFSFISLFVFVIVIRFSRTQLALSASDTKALLETGYILTFSALARLIIPFFGGSMAESSLAIMGFFLEQFPELIAFFFAIHHISAFNEMTKLVPVVDIDVGSEYSFKF